MWEVSFSMKNLEFVANFFKFSAASNFHSLQKLCPVEKIPLVEALTRKEMSRIINKFPYVGVVGVMDFQNFEVRLAIRSPLLLQPRSTAHSARDAEFFFLAPTQIFTVFKTYFRYFSTKFSEKF